MDKSRRYQLLAIIRSIPRHLVTKQSWRRLKSDPLRCILCVVGPILFTIAQRKIRDERSALETTLNRLVEMIGTKGEIIPAGLWPNEPNLSKYKNRSKIDQLNKLFSHYGSDKTIHGYGDIYQTIFAQIYARCEDLNPTIVEIGIGSRNPAVQSNMGVFGTPGASLRAFREFTGTANVVGGDIDLAALFQEERIKTLQVNQLDLKSLGQFLEKSGEFDLLIDDGLHDLDANLNTLTAALAYTKPGSWVVIEDIDSTDSHVWLAVANLLSHKYLSWLIKANQSLLFVIHHGIQPTQSQ